MANYNMTGIRATNYAVMNYYNNSNNSNGIYGSTYGSVDNAWSYINDISALAGKNTAATAQATKEYVSSVKEYSNQLLKAAENMTSRFPPLFKQLTDSLSNNEVLDVKDIKSYADNNKVIDVNVKQTATGQKNVGERVDSASKTMPRGTNAFEISKDGKAYNLSVDIADDDNNLTAQLKVADAINKKNIGLFAHVSHDTKTGESFMTIESKETGEKQAFSIADKTENGIISALGIENVETKARDAIINVNNGIDLRSATNDVNIGNGITATLKNVGSVKVGLKADSDKIMGGVRDLINSYNSLLESTKSYNSTGSERISDQLARAFKSHSASLASVGITADKNGYLTLDETKAKSAIEKGSMERALGVNGYSTTGFVGSIRQTARSVSSNPNQYIGMQKSDNNSSNNFFDFNTAYGNNLYGSMTGFGLLFSALF